MLYQVISVYVRFVQVRSRYIRLGQFIHVSSCYIRLNLVVSGMFMLVKVRLA
jgi:hypothetical protein